MQVSTAEGFLLSASHNIAFHEISVAENPSQMDKLVNTTILQLRRMDPDQEKSRKQTVWNMSRVISNILGGGRGSLPPDLGAENKGGGGRLEKMSFKTVFKKRSV